MKALPAELGATHREMATMQIFCRQRINGAALACTHTWALGMDLAKHPWLQPAIAFYLLLQLNFISCFLIHNETSIVKENCLFLRIINVGCGAAGLLQFSWRCDLTKIPDFSSAFNQPRTALQLIYAVILRRLEFSLHQFFWLLCKIIFLCKEISP